MQTVESIIETTMAQLKSIVDVNTIVGQPVLSKKDVLVVPVSKVCFGFFSGGGEYPPMGKVQKAAESIGSKEGYPFLGTAIAGVSITPKAFLAASGEQVSVLPAQYEGTFDRLVELMPKMVETLTGVMKKPCACQNASNEKQENKKQENQKQEQVQPHGQEESHVPSQPQPAAMEAEQS